QAREVGKDREDRKARKGGVQGAQAREDRAAGEALGARETRLRGAQAQGRGNPVAGAGGHRPATLAGRGHARADVALHHAGHASRSESRRAARRDGDRNTGGAGATGSHEDAAKENNARQTVSLTSSVASINAPRSIRASRIDSRRRGRLRRTL